MGKKRLKVMLAREEIARSESTLGRILAKGVRLGRIAPCASCRGRVTAKKRRTFAKGHAQRWTADTKAARPGEWIQIDHMSVSRDGDTLKEFKATCPIGKQLAVRVYSRATAGNARRFLQALREDLPYPVRSIPVDGGSEFRAEFEDARQALNLPLGPALAEYQRFYNHVRPHYALDLRTPMEYLLQNRPAESGQSQM